jgi:CheY-like chemotaxis protein
MEHFGINMVPNQGRNAPPFRDRTIPAQRSVLVVRDDDKNSEVLDAICEFLDIAVEHAASGGDLGPLLLGLRPMAVIADLEGDVQDGFHVMKMAAGYDRKLPILLLTGNEILLQGAIDAVKEVWGLKHVATAAGMGSVGDVVDFLCHAARDAGRSRMMRI